MHHQLSLAFAVLVALAVDGVSQTSYLPAGITLPGNDQQTSNWRGSRRHQVIYHPLAVPTVNGAIHGLELRADQGTFVPTPEQFDISVLLSSVGVPLPANMAQDSFSANLGSDATIVVNTQRVTLPAGASATFALTFAQPFPYQNGNPLLIQLEFAPVITPGNDNPSWMLDAQSLPNAFFGTAGATTGNACPAPGSWTVFSDQYGDRLTFRWGTVPVAGNLPAFLFLGLSNQHFGALALPINLTAFGAPGCALQTSVDAVFNSNTALGGGFSWVLASAPLPRDPGLVGMTIFAQAMVLDPAANAIGLRLSELRGEQLVTPATQVLVARSLGQFAAGFPNDVPELFARNSALVLGLQ